MSDKANLYSTKFYNSISTEIDMKSLVKTRARLSSFDLCSAIFITSEALGNYSSYLSSFICKMK